MPAVAAGTRERDRIHPMVSRPSYAVTLLADPAQVLERVEPFLDRGTAGRDCVIGLIGWASAGPDETSGLSAVRDSHRGPLVAILAELPAARGARVVAARLDGAVMLTEAERTLAPTLAAVAVGQRVVPGAIRQVVDRPPLSPRERQILAMVVMDFSNAEIARKLFISESNVKNTLSSAFAKLGVASRNAAAELILDNESGLGPGILRISPEEPLP